MDSTRAKIIRRSLSAAAVIAAAYLLIQAISIHTFGFHDDGMHADVAVVLGAAAYHKKPSPVFEERINHAINLYKSGRVEQIMLTGGFGEGAPFAESEVARLYCLDKGLPESALLMETRSKTTWENLREAKPILEENGWKSALIVSDPWHLKRAVAMARHLGIEAHPAGTPTTRFRSLKARAGFLVREVWYYHEFLFFGP
ncbi:MAG: YdcF family protein [Akkermansiaceae bacterium]|nr:YdcF family protein [Akkermansiaceae bacterium]